MSRKQMSCECPKKFTAPDAPFRVHDSIRIGYAFLLESWFVRVGVVPVCGAWARVFWGGFLVEVAGGAGGGWGVGGGGVG